jgi:hypothetical protein
LATRLGSSLWGSISVDELIRLCPVKKKSFTIRFLEDRF